MAYAFIVLGLLLTISGARGTQDDLFALLRNDFSGSNSFLWWLVAIAIIGGVGYAPPLRGLSHAFLALVLIVLLLANRGVFEQFTNAIKGASLEAAPADGTETKSVLLNPNLFGDFTKLPDYLTGTA